MKTCRHTRFSFCLLLSSLLIALAAAAPRAESQSGAILVVRRIPNLGNNIFVDLAIDGRRVASIGYGHTYQTVLPPGRHVLAVLATPHPNYREWWTTEVHVRAGQTYSYTAARFAGQLILRRNR